MEPDFNDTAILDLYWSRDEDAIRRTAERYGHYCMTVALGVTGNRQDAEECVNDTWLRAWNSIPPARPDDLCAYLARITRNLALDRLSYDRASKRGGFDEPTALDELADILSDPETPSDALAMQELSADIDRFLRTLPTRECDLFVLRYFWSEPVADVAKRYGITKNHVSVILRRTRRKLKKYLTERGYDL